MGIFSARQTYLGIDIGGSTLKLVELERKGKKIVLRNYASTYSNIKSDPLIKERENFLKMSSKSLGKILKEVFKATSFKSESAALSIPIHSTFTTILHLPAELEEEELNNAIRYEAKKHVPIPIEQITLDWRIVRETEKTNTSNKNVLSSKKKGPMIQEVFLMATPKDVILKYKSLTDFLSVKPEVLEVEIFSLFRASGVGDKGNHIFIDIGGRNTNVTLFSNTFIKDTFNINISGDDFTRAILHQKRTLSFDQAEKLKVEQGLGSDIVKKALLPYFDDLIERIKRRQPKDFTIDSIVLAGGTVLLKGLNQYFSEKFGVSIELINPWKNIVVPSEIQENLHRKGASFAVAVGLALRGLEE